MHSTAAAVRRIAHCWLGGCWLATAAPSFPASLLCLPAATLHNIASHLRKGIMPWGGFLNRELNLVIIMKVNLRKMLLLCSYPFATWYPRKAKLIDKTAMGRVLNNFTIFSITHIAMWLIFYVCLFIHPYPGTPGRHFFHHNTTWVRCMFHCFQFSGLLELHPAHPLLKAK